MKKIFYLSVALAATLAASAQQTYTVDGVTYTVTSESPKTCEITDGKNPTTPQLSIPETVEGYTVTAIAKEAFRLSSVNSVTMPNTITAMGNNAFYFSDLRSIALSTSLTVIPDSCFRLTLLNSIVIPEGVTELKSYVFNGCGNLKSIKLPSTLVSIGNSALNQKNDIQTITCYAVTPPVCTNTLFGAEYDNPSLKILVPAASVEAYKAAKGWSTFANKIEAMPGFTVFVKADKTPNIYGWTAKESDIFGQWPGAAMTQTALIAGESFYYYTITGYDSVNIIISIGYAQTNDINNVSSDIYFDGTKQIDKPSTGVNGIAAKAPAAKVYVNGQDVHIEGAPEGSLVTVFNQTGQILKQTHEHTFTLDRNGIMLINVDGHTYKIAE